MRLVVPALVQLAGIAGVGAFTLLQLCERYKTGADGSLLRGKKNLSQSEVVFLGDRA
jgi:hypothetical protein